MFLFRFLGNQVSFKPIVGGVSGSSEDIGARLFYFIQPVSRKPNFDKSFLDDFLGIPFRAGKFTQEWVKLCVVTLV